MKWNIPVEKYKDYCLDSGATCHVTNDLKGLQDIEDVNTKIMVAQNSTCKATKCGSLNLKIFGLPAEMRVKLKRVYFVQEFNKNIVSIKQLTKDNYEVSFKRNTCEIMTPSGGTLRISNDNDGMFYI